MSDFLQLQNLRFGHYRKIKSTLESFEKSGEKLEALILMQSLLEFWMFLYLRYEKKVEPWKDDRKFKNSKQKIPTLGDVRRYCEQVNLNKSSIAIIKQFTDARNSIIHDHYRYVVDLYPIGVQLESSVPLDFVFDEAKMKFEIQECLKFGRQIISDMESDDSNFFADEI